MLLRNYDNIMLARMHPATSESYTIPSSEEVFGDGYVNFKDTSGTLRQLCGHSSYYIYNALAYFNENGVGSSYGGSASNLICGSGSTPETYDDYKLESEFTTTQISSVSGVHRIETPVYDEKTNTWTFTYSRNYLAKQDITVREIGVTANSYYTSSNYRLALVYRKVLETPLEVTAGNQFKLSFTATLSANPNKPANYDASAAVV